MSIIDFGMMPQPYIVMEWIPGPDLSESFAAGVRFSREHQIEIFRQLADALLHAHSMHVTHRDLKPANIKVLFTPQKEPRAKILDFGLQRIRIGRAGDRHLRCHGDVCVSVVGSGVSWREVRTGDSGLRRRCTSGC
ncbi:MAG: protein kinase [Candidatus Obscuribacterales bacterium]|nr:protein kinase [Candidatus Obscuribacterales bacterium]